MRNYQIMYKENGSPSRMIDVEVTDHAANKDPMGQAALIKADLLGDPNVVGVFLNGTFIG